MWQHFSARRVSSQVFTLSTRDEQAESPAGRKRRCDQNAHQPMKSPSKQSGRLWRVTYHLGSEAAVLGLVGTSKVLEADVDGLRKRLGWAKGDISLVGEKLGLQGATSGTLPHPTHQNWMGEADGSRVVPLSGLIAACLRANQRRRRATFLKESERCRPCQSLYICFARQ